MTKDNTVFIGLDTHKESIEVAYIVAHHGSASTHFGKIP